ncbi:MAG: DUF4278 domain-containing protein [Jaaginema sp. PMC 1079.18]|nr:DUF4278 domain-containing protein [Jaaginema sp. PMC 1080.18]MEC4849402.1 DUF4278 domain-containing protein [Jaaginema sp. PMC 1079.18]MEC4864966.1 DUF4278 domain-containing protein [Jaaginema sp. PMC 1078.18]
MQYTYRGVNYDRAPLSLEVTEGEIAGSYRGQAWRKNHPRHVLELKPKPPLQYRGVPYGQQTYVQTQSGPRATCQLKSLPSIPELNNSERQTRHNLAQQIHLENIRRHLEHRIQVATAKGDRELIAILKRESQELAIES